MKLHLKRGTCNCTVSNEPRYCPPFLFHGYDDAMEWSDFVDDVPDLETRFWQRSDTLPNPGESRLVKLRDPFCRSTGEDFWSLFLPGLSSVNGWGEYPNEIDLSAFVQCSLTDVISANSGRAWARIAVSRVIMLRDACTLLPAATDDSDFISGIADFSWRHLTIFGNWILFEGNFEGDLGRWALVNVREGKYHLIMFGEWGFHESDAYFGNLIQPKKYIDELIEIFSRDKN